MPASAPQTSPHPLDQARWWVAIWVVVGTVHLCPSIWFSAGSALPGDLGDSRFNQLVLEHGYRSLIGGSYDWSSPAQFFPAEDTLGWSDTHVGTLPIYLAPRLLGLGSERSMQIWFLALAALNLLSAWKLFKEAGVAGRWTAPLAVAAFAGSPWVWLTGTHAQMLPVFPGLWMGIFLIRYARTREKEQLLLAAGAGLGQFAAGPYLAFFIGSITLGLIAALGVLGRSTSKSSTSKETTPAPSYSVRILAGLGAALGLVNLWVYTHTLQSGFERSMQDVINLTPYWSSWFSAPPAHAWWPTGWPGGSPEHSEHVLFGGFLPWVLGLLSMVVAWPHRHSEFRARLAIACAATAVAVVLFTVRWTGEVSIWIWLCELVEPLRGFRAIGRIHILVHSLLVLSFALSLGLGWWRRLPRLVAPAAIILLLLETGASYQPSFQITDAQARREAVLTAWEQSGDRPILAYAPGFTNQPDTYIQLDAWAAALASDRHTLNGYSGGAPISHLQFIWNPIRDQAESLMYLHKIPATDVSIVERFDEETATKLGFVYQEQRSLRQLQGFDLQPSHWELFSPIEEFRIDGRFFYQFTPPANVRFRIPDQANSLSYITAMRDGAFDGANDSDGYDLSVLILMDGSTLLKTEEVVNPRDDVGARGLLERTINLPTGRNREVVFEFGPGPSGQSPWDWPLLSQLKIE